MGFVFEDCAMSLYTDNKYIRLISSRLRNFKQKKDDLYNFSCPICGDSRKNLHKARGYAFKKGNDLFYTCHNCGVGTTLAKLIEHIDPTLYKEYILERYTSGEVGRGKTKSTIPFNIKPPKFGSIEDKKGYEHAEFCSDLTDENSCKVYLKSRKIPEKYYSKLLYTKHYKLFIDTLIPDHGKDKLTDDERLVIPFFDEYNELIAVSGRALSTTTNKLRYVTLRTKESNEKLIYGLERVDKNKLVKIVEGPIDSLFLDNCVASGDSNLTIAAKTLNAKDMVLIFDNEPKNKEIVNMVKTAIDNNYKVVIWPENISEKDINDMIISGRTAEDIENIIKTNTFSGLEAFVKLTFWKRV